MRSRRRSAARSAGSRSRVPRGARKVGIGRKSSASVRAADRPATLRARPSPTAVACRDPSRESADVAPRSASPGTPSASRSCSSACAPCSTSAAPAPTAAVRRARLVPDGVPLAMVGGIFGLFVVGGLDRLVRVADRTRSPRSWPRWPALFLSLGWNFLEYALHPPATTALVWGWLIPGVLFVLMGAGPLLAALPGRSGARRSPSLRDRHDRVSSASDDAIGRRAEPVDRSSRDSWSTRSRRAADPRARRASDDRERRPIDADVADARRTAGRAPDRGALDDAESRWRARADPRRRSRGAASVGERPSSRRSTP